MIPGRVTYRETGKKTLDTKMAQKIPNAILITGVNEFPPPVLDEVVEAELEVFLWCCICICGEPDLLEILEASPEVVGLLSLSC